MISLHLLFFSTYCWYTLPNGTHKHTHTNIHTHTQIYTHTHKYTHTHTHTQTHTTLGRDYPCINQNGIPSLSEIHSGSCQS